MARTRKVIMIIWRILLGICHVDSAVEVADIKRCKIRGKSIRARRWICKGETALENKVLVVRLDLIGVKISHIQKIMATRDAYRRAFINCAGCAVIFCYNCVCAFDVRIPSRYHAVLADKDKPGGLRVYAFGDLEKRSAVGDDARRVRPIIVCRAWRNRYYTGSS